MPCRCWIIRESGQGSPVELGGLRMSLSRRTLLAASSALAVSGFTARLLADDPAKEPQPAKSDKDNTFNEFTPQSERAVRKGDEWLMKTMHRDGGCGVDIGQPTDIGCSAMVGLCL